MKLVLALALAFSLSTFGQIRNDKIGNDALNYLVEKANKETLIDLSSWEKNELAGRRFRLTSRFAYKTQSTCLVYHYERNERTEYFRFKKKDTFRNLTWTECNNYSTHLTYIKRNAYFIDGEVLIKNSPLNTTIPVGANCILDQIQSLKNVLNKPENQALMKELEITQIHLDLFNNYYGAYADKNLNYGLTVTLDPVLNVQVLVTQAGKCVNSSEADIADAFARFNKDATLQVIRDRNAAAATARAKAAELKKP